MNSALHLSHMSLEAQSQQRKDRLSRFKDLKRKERPDEGATSKENKGLEILSRRNFDVVERNAKFGYDENPAENKTTVEKRALEIAEEEELERSKEKQRQLDVESLQPKKANWDLKRDIEPKLAILKVKTDAAIAKLVRERIKDQNQSGARDQLQGDLAEVVKQKEAEERDSDL